MAALTKPASLRNGCSNHGAAIRARQLWLFQSQPCALGDERTEPLARRRPAVETKRTNNSSNTTVRRAASRAVTRAASPKQPKGEAPNANAASRAVAVTTIEPHPFLRIGESLGIVALVVLFLGLACLAT
ncbi:MAG: hypothetical protein H6832_02540 [Planctomycetes bacterium]|nr:hypothetical protein [Planctomycetota bacterium]MCB9917263.1 hypothetical protein [Planctomycetota bacterium]